MAKLSHSEVQYPCSSEEIHVVTPLGKSVYITNDIDLARKHKGIAFGFKIVRVITRRELAA